MSDASAPLYFGFLALLVITITAALLGVRVSESDGSGPSGTALPISRFAMGLAAWLAITGVAAASGFTSRWELRPPPVMGFAFFGFAATIILARGRLGEQIAMGLPVAALIAFQGFRFPLELLLHRAYTDGVMPIQMSFEGQNFDIATGLLGLAIGGYFLVTDREVPRSIAWAFNIVGLALLFNILGVAVASMPIIAAYGPDALNLWVGAFPFIWLPTVFVPFALLGHVVLTRRLLADAKS